MAMLYLEDKIREFDLENRDGVLAWDHEDDYNLKTVGMREDDFQKTLGTPAPTLEYIVLGCCDKK